MSKSSGWDDFFDEWGGLLAFVVIIALFVLIANWNNIQSFFNPNINSGVYKGSCKDVTSYDYNWDNDMLCTRPDGSTFYTDYAGARKYEASFR